MINDDIPQSERKRVLLQDADVKQQQQRGTSYFKFAQADAQVDHGRFAAINKTTVVGSEVEAARYPAASSAHQTELPPEPPFGVAIEQIERE